VGEEIPVYQLHVLFLYAAEIFVGILFLFYGDQMLLILLCFGDVFSHATDRLFYVYNTSARGRLGDTRQK
jgi:hypothetical protein